MKALISVSGWNRSFLEVRKCDLDMNAHCMDQAWCMAFVGLFNPHYPTWVIVSLRTSLFVPNVERL